MNTSCGRPWIFEFLQDNVYKSFLNNEYKKHREKQLFNLELSYLPATQVALEKDIKVEDLNLLIQEKQNAMRRLKDEIIEVQYEISRVRNTTVVREERRQFVRACPADDCRGFLSTQWKCGICKVNVCKDCHEIKAMGEDAQEHVCKPEMVESARLLAKETKNCPKCAAVIFKTSGCDQMFCTQCQTAFSWTTLKIVTGGRIHNPHYYEWLRNQAPDGNIPREPGDDPCGALNARQLPDNWMLQQKFRKSGIQTVAANHRITNDASTDIGKFWLIYRMIAHISDVEMRRYPEAQQIDVDANMDIRKRFMRNWMTREAFQTLLQQREKKRQKCNEFNQIMAMFTQVCSEHVRQLANLENIRQADLAKFIHDTELLRVYFNTACETVGKRYKNVSPFINIEWQLSTIQA